MNILLSWLTKLNELPRLGSFMANLSTFAVFWVSALCWAPTVEAAASSSKIFQSIKQRGEVTIGVKSDFAPFGSLDASGLPVGLEVDLAKRLARDLGVELRLIPVTTENRLQRLQQGVVDIIIATAGDTQERRLLATAIEPHYYASGVNVLLRPETTARSWHELRGRSLCALHGSYFNRAMTQRHILDLVLFRSVRDALLALRDGRCLGFLYTDLAVNNYLSLPEFSQFRLLDETALSVPWAISVAKSEGGTDFEIRLSEAIAGWHREGLIIELERRWNLGASQFVKDARELWSREDTSGKYVCTRDTNGILPLECRHKAFVTSNEVDGSQKLGLWLKEKLNINLPVVYDPFDRQRYLTGLLHTLFLSVAAVALSLVLGYFGAWVMLSSGPLIIFIVRPVVTIGRMTPPILQMYLLFFGFGSWVKAEFGVSPSPLSVAILALGLYHGCIIVTALLEGARILKAQDKHFRLSLSKAPELFTVCAVGVRTALNNLIKATTIAAAISVPELLSATVSIISDYGNPEVMMPLLLVSFYIYTTAFIAVWMRIEKLASARCPA